MSFIPSEIAQAIDNPAAVVGFVAAAVVGLASSLHCFLMCGPLACAGFAGRKPDPRAIAAYQGGRIASYAVVGGLLGAIGGGVASLLSVSVRPYLPWVMAAALIATAFDLGKHLPAIPGMGRISRAVGRASARLSPAARSGAIGALTPLLPCGLLYGIFAASLASGSFGAGASVMGGFALGGAPALLAAQFQAGFVRRLPRLPAMALRRGIPLVAAAVLVYRAVMIQQTGGASCH